MAGWWDWLIHTDAGLAARIVAGSVVLGSLAVADYRKNGRQATRWREYVFLLAVTGIVLGYGAINDQITSAISWEYFYYGKGLNEVLGDQLPPDAVQLHLAAAKVGLKATWSVGLLIGVALLMANNPRPNRPRLCYRSLFGTIPLMLAVTVFTAGIFAVLGYAGVFAHFSEDFRQMVAHDEFRPRRFMMVFGIHLGGYLGGLVGAVAAVVAVLRERRIRSGGSCGGDQSPRLPR